MALKLQIRDDFWRTSTVPLEVDSIQVSHLCQQSTDEINRTLIWQGKMNLELGEAFQVSGTLSDGCINWQGDLARVHWIGARHSGGVMTIQGNAGRHLGSQMSGGEIVVEGDVGDFAGVEMTGGRIRVSGNGGNRIGARYPGSTYGMNRGSIFVEGDVGCGLGENMRRGAIVVGGDAGDLVGWNMLAGTICVVGSMGRYAGAGMVRGTIVCHSGDEVELVPTFSQGPDVDAPEWMRLFAAWLRAEGNLVADQFLSTRYRLFSGDMLYGGRGEFWQAI